MSESKGECASVRAGASVRQCELEPRGGGDGGGGTTRAVVYLPVTVRVVRDVAVVGMVALQIHIKRACATSIRVVNLAATRGVVRGTKSGAWGMGYVVQDC